MLSRRQFLKGVALTGVGSMSFGGYALAEPFRVGVTRYSVSPPDWLPGLELRIAVLTDLHICEPWLGLDRLRRIVARTNALGADVILMLGDYVRGGRIGNWSREVKHEEWAAVLGGLKAPLGVHAILGNHDWWEDIDVQRRHSGPVKSQVALEAAGIPVYENDAFRFEKDGLPFWIAGIGDQWAFWLPRSARKGKRREESYEGVDDLAGTLEKITDDAPVILMVHEPDIFPEVPSRVALTLAGHTHGGQVTIAGYAPTIPSKYGQRYRYGHIVEEGRNMIVSAGIGCSSLPIRFGAPPEIVLITAASGQDVA
ncbi:metallophosphoesterase [Hyphomicrobium sp. LHD-15]|uniref:metallophosphoesterase n=1 Tax=Hyphomicrobium sp. LHD-15 TaxID=3072142 RepID=UPI00280D5392|nr:metallophosphoesterase [Hyphomicrobium sp. LHD-15]MDQ8700770.1 metallophosphoesterase [Hyphomicrobium sp. LHD-15]